MRPQRIALVAAVMLVIGWAVAHHGVALAADGDQCIGTWKGSWEGAGAGGRFDLTFTKGSDGKLAASVSVGTDMGDYKAQFSAVTVTGDKLAGAYDYPPDPQGEVTLTGNFDSTSAIGTWSLGAKGQPGGQAIAGTWKVTKQ
jgi:hypothetical protein